MRKLILILVCVFTLLFCLACTALIIGTRGSFSVSGIKYDNASRYTPGNGEVDANKVEAISINWISGNVRIVEGNGRSVSFSEQSEKALNKDTCMYWLLDGKTLRIQFCKSGFNGKNRSDKELTVVVPKGMALSLLDVDFVSSTVDSEINAQKYDFDGVSGTINLSCTIESKVDIETVSSRINLDFAKCPATMDIEGVSEKISLRIPSDSGFTLSMETVSGGVDCSIPTVTKDKKMVAGDGKSILKIKSVSGSISVTGK